MAADPVLTTFVFDDKLPSLPVPDLEDTLERYSQSIKPFLNQSDYANSIATINDFKSGIGLKLQDKLLERAKTRKNWVRTSLNPSNEIRTY